MLIDFTVENFRSIHEPVTLSMVEVSPRKTSQTGARRKRYVPTDEEISPALEVPDWDFKLLRTAGIFGANASGKSNVVKALVWLAKFVCVPNGSPAEYFSELAPFKLCADAAVGPARLRARVALKVTGQTVIFRYEISLGARTVGHESLSIERQDGTVQGVFERVVGQPTRSRFAEMLPPAIAASEPTLSSDVPLLRVIIQMFQVPELLPFQYWLLGVFASSEARVEQVQGAVTKHFSQNRNGFLERISSLLKEFDTGISSLRIHRTEDDRTRVFVMHSCGNGKVEWELDEESAGTKRLYDLAGAILFALDAGLTVVFDELGANLHPHITQRIIALFQNPASNAKGAQLVFNSHDVTLLADHRLRRDQVWYTQKRPDGSTELFPLSDFKPRNDLTIDTAYLDGRFGAVPYLARIGGL